MVKQEYLPKAEKLFADLAVQISSGGRRGNWLSRFCSRIFGGIDSRVARIFGALVTPSQSVNPMQQNNIMQLLSKASQQNGAKLAFSG